MPILDADGNPTVDRNGKERMMFFRIGVNVYMADGSWWHRHDKHGTWTFHSTGLDRDEFDDSLLTVDRKDSYTHRRLVRDWGDKPGFLLALFDGVQLAEELYAARRG